MATKAEPSRKPSFLKLASKSTRSISNKSEKKNFKSKGDSSVCTTETVSSELSSKSFLGGITDAINATNSGVAKEAVVVSVNEPPPQPSPASSFLSRWSSVGSPDEEPKEEKKEEAPAPKPTNSASSFKLPWSSVGSSPEEPKEEKKEEAPAPKPANSASSFKLPWSSVGSSTEEPKEEKKEAVPCVAKEAVVVSVNEPPPQPSSASSFLSRWSSVGSSTEEPKEEKKEGAPGVSQEAVVVRVNEPPPQPSSASSFLSRWSSVGSSPEEPKEEKKEAAPAPKPTKWRTSSIRESSSLSSVQSDRPSVYAESLEMIIAALLIYTFADLRKMAREGKIPSDKLTKHPISISQVMEAIRTHREALEEEAKIDQDDLVSRLNALKHVHDKQQGASSMVGRMLRGSSKKKETVLTHFHDEQSTKGMVYAIAVNHIRKRITVIFRGSVTQQDFITDVNLAQKVVNNPVVKVATETPTTINIHTGFYQYLFKKDDTGRVRLEHILDDVKALMKQYKGTGFRLYCTGHSLGGALSSLCGFYAACDPQITKNGPVTVVSIASPRVGDNGFRTAFQNLERLQLVQHLRISNFDDVVTLLPFAAWKETGLSPSMLAPTNYSANLYKHCGIHLKFKSGYPENCEDERQIFSVTYAKDRNDEEGMVPEDFRRSLVAAKSLAGSLIATRALADFKSVKNFHCCDEYERRLENSKDYLASINLDQLYADQALVGAVVAAPPVLEPNTSRRSLFGKKKSSRSQKSCDYV